MFQNNRRRSKGRWTPARLGHAVDPRRAFCPFLRRTRWTRYQPTTTIGAAALQGVAGAIDAEGAFEGTDHGVGTVRRQIDVAAFTTRPHLQHDNLLA